MARTFTQLFKSALLAALSVAAVSQVANAQTSTYFFTQSSTVYTPLSAGTTIAQATGGAAAQRLNDGNFSASIPFSFNFNGNAFTTVNVNANGYITFGATTPATTLTTPISAATGYTGAAAALGTDIEGVYEFTADVVMNEAHVSSVSRFAGLKVGQTVTGTGIPAGTTIISITNDGIITLSNPAAAGGAGVTLTAASGVISTQTLGAAPNRIFVIQWDGFKQVGAPNSLLNFQIQLYEANNNVNAQSVQIVYGPCVFTASGAAEVGLRGAINTDYNNRTGFTFTNTGSGLANNATIGFNTATIIPSGLTHTWMRLAPATCGGTPTAGQGVSSVASSCTGSLALSATGASTGAGISYQWQSSSSATGPWTDISGATTNPYIASSSNSVIYYHLNVKCGVSNITTSSTVAAVNNAALTVTLGNDTTLCPGASLALNAGNPGKNFSWNTGATTQFNTILTGSTYSVLVTDPQSGCSGQDAIIITNATLPTVNLGPDRSICQGTTTTLNAGAGSSFSWNTGANTQSISVDRNGAFSVTVTNAAHCTNSDTVNISVDPLPSASFIFYNGVLPTLTFGVSIVNNVTGYLWDFGDGSPTSNLASPTHTFTVDGNFNVRLIVSNNCGTDTVSEPVHITGTGHSSSVGQTALNEDAISVYPNPAHDYVSLDNKSNLKIMSTQVINVLGATVMQQSGNAGKMQITTGALPTGSYMLRVQTDKGIILKKLQVLK